MEIELPDPSLILLIGPSGSGKSTFAQKHFSPTEILSSDRCRALVSDNPNNQSATDAAFEVLHLILRKRLERHRLTAVDATNTQPRARRPLLAIANAHQIPSMALVFLLPEELYMEHDRLRAERAVGESVIRIQMRELRDSIPFLENEGFDEVYFLREPDQIDSVQFRRIRTQSAVDAPQNMI